MAEPTPIGISHSGPHVELRIFESRKHAALLEAWLGQPHVREWWGDQLDELPELAERSADSHAVIYANGVPAGYVCWGRLSPADLSSAGLAALSGSLIDIDILIGEPHLTGRGIGPRALQLLLLQLRTNTAARWAGVGTSRSNRRALAAFEKAGFRRFRDFDDPDFGPSTYLITELHADA